MTVAIVDYGSGNLHSARKALERAARDAQLSAPVIVTPHADDIRRADRIVLPGVGAFADCRRGLYDSPGLVEALDEAVRKKARPFLGICVGMQLLASRGHEYGIVEGLGWIAGDVRRIDVGATHLKIPHMGWNALALRGKHPLLRDIAGAEAPTYAYFVHSYHFAPADPGDILATTCHGETFAAAVGRETVAGVQFHPEKSQAIGLRLLRNFLTWRP